MSARKRLTHIASFGIAIILLIGSAAMTTQQPAAASSHREAPLISEDPSADNTDTYAFVSPDKPDTVTLIGSWIPGELPHGGPNYYSFGDDVIYSLNVDNNGDAKPDFTYKFTFRKQTRNPNTFLYNVAPIKDIRSDAFNVPQFGTMYEVVDGQERPVYTDFALAPVNIGSKSTPEYEKLWKSSIISVPTEDGDIKAFAGQTDDPFWVDLQVFDLLTLRGNPAPIGYEKGRKKPTDGLKKFNVHSIAVQVPIAHLLKCAPAGETTIGVWATSERYSMRAYGGGAIPIAATRANQPPGYAARQRSGVTTGAQGCLQQHSADDRFRLVHQRYASGELLKKSVLNPELQNLLQALYGVPHPIADRTDLLAIFLTGMKTTKPFTIHTKNGDAILPAGFNVNQPMNVRPAEMIRLNTAIKGDLCKPKPDYQLGLLGGDACGFPNGRRLRDDVPEIELAAVAGAAYPC